MAKEAMNSHDREGMLEEMLDYTNDEAPVSAILEDLASVLQAKADHLRSSWQDEAGAKAWEAKARLVCGASISLHRYETERRG